MKRALANSLIFLMQAGEAINPRKIMPRAFKTVFFRLIFLFVALSTFKPGQAFAHALSIDTASCFLPLPLVSWLATMMRS